MKLLITGGLGNVGSTFALGAPAEWSVTTVDVAADRYGVCNLVQNRGRGNFAIQEDIEHLSGKHLPYQPDFLIHCAAEVDPQGSGVAARRYNTKLTASAVSLANQLKCHLIFISTTSVYERTNCIEPAYDVTGGYTEYSRGKLEEEELISSNSSRFTILRLGSVYGISAHTNWRTAINKMVRDSVVSREVRVWRKSLNSVSPHVSIAALPGVLKCMLTSTELAGKTLNYATLNSSLAQIAETICETNPGTRIALEDHPNAKELHLIVQSSECFAKFRTPNDLSMQIRRMMSEVTPGPMKVNTNDSAEEDA